MAATAVEKVHALWDCLADYPASQADAALEHLLRTMAEWLRADDVMWIGAVRMSKGVHARRDGQHGWRGRVVPDVVVLPDGRSVPVALGCEPESLDTPEAREVAVRAAYDGFLAGIRASEVR